ncbi:MAG: alpha/beta fold hydrolase [Solirubrobacteraceae bacterium]
MTDHLTAGVRQWQQRGSMVEINGRRLFVREQAGEGPLLVFLHGFPSSSYDWRFVLDLLPGRRALLADFLGFGLSEKPREHVYSLAWQADAIEDLVCRAGSPPAFLVAHDMGTSVATELMARELRGELNLKIGGALLFNGSILLDRANPTLRNGPRRCFHVRGVPARVPSRPKVPASVIPLTCRRYCRLTD